jgi:excisionase family DNA binding protein
VPELALGVEEAAADMGVSKNTLYGLIAAEAIPFVRFGRTIRIPRSAFVAWLDERATAHATIGSEKSE